MLIEQILFIGTVLLIMGLAVHLLLPDEIRKNNKDGTK